MIELEIRLLFLNYNIEKSEIEYELYKTTDKSIKTKLKKKIGKIEKLQLDLIQQYLEEVGLDLPLEMQCYFTGERLFPDKNEMLYDWGIAYAFGGKIIKEELK